VPLEWRMYVAYCLPKLGRVLRMFLLVEGSHLVFVRAWELLGPWVADARKTCFSSDVCPPSLNRPLLFPPLSTG
jgi:hypothetical protein